MRRDGVSTYFVVDAATGATLQGPFDRPCYAVGCVHSVAHTRGGRVLDGLFYNVNVLASELRELQARVNQLANECRSRAREFAGDGRTVWHEPLNDEAEANGAVATIVR